MAKKNFACFAAIVLVFSACSSSSGPDSDPENCAGFNEKRQICDERDGKKYSYVQIGSQTWMAENLNYDGGNGKAGRCYGDVGGNCDTYGRLYILEEAACPYGWHLPSKAEWQTLINFVHPNPNDGTYFLSAAGTKLKASDGWGSGNGTDDYGFAALPGGYCGDACPVDSSPFTNIGSSSYWWSTSVGSPVPLSITYTISATATSVNEMQSYSTSRFYARCVKDQSSMPPYSLVIARW